MGLFHWFLSLWLSLIYRKAIIFYVLVLYPATLLNAFINCRIFPDRVFRTFLHRIVFSNKDTFEFFSFLLVSPLSPSLVLLFWVKLQTVCGAGMGTTVTLLFSWFSRKASCFSPLSMMLAVDLKHNAFIVLRCIPYIPRHSRMLITKGYWSVSGPFLYIIRWFVISNL